MIERSAATVVLLWLLVILGGCAGEDASLPRAEVAPLPIIEVARDWSAEVDFLALREEFGQRGDFDAVCKDGRPFEAMLDAMDEGDWEKALELSSGWLNRCAIDFEVHMLRAVALLETDRVREAHWHSRWREGLIASILDSGTGESSDSPWLVISVAEEYAILRALGLRWKQHFLLEGDIDLQVATNRDGAEVSRFFDPAAHFARMQEKFPWLEDERARR